jgi:hypothetical protein
MKPRFHLRMLKSNQAKLGNCFLRQKIVQIAQQRSAIPSEVNCEGLLRGMLTFLVLLVHDSSCLHTRTVAHTRALREHFDWELFDYLPYIPDLFGIVKIIEGNWTTPCGGGLEYFHRSPCES